MLVDDIIDHEHVVLLAQVCDLLNFGSEKMSSDKCQKVSRNRDKE